MIIVVIRTLIMYALVLFAIRLMGKQELSKMSAFQFVIVFMVAELASVPIDSTDEPLLNGVISIVTLTFLQILISHISIKSDGFKTFVNGRPSIIVEKGKINYEELAKLRITTTDLMEQLRLENCPSLSDVQYAVMESNGQMTVIPKAQNKPLTPKDISLAVTEGILPMIVVSDGVLYSANLFKLGMTEEALRALLRAQSIEGYDDIFMAYYDENRKIHVLRRSDKSRPYAQEVVL